MNRRGPADRGTRVIRGLVIRGLVIRGLVIRGLVIRGLVIRVTALALLCAVTVPWATVPAHAAGPRQGDAVVVAHPDSDQALGAGGSGTLFSLKLPDGASCPGDSANDGYRIQGFMVPAADDPGTLRYKSIQPEGEGRWGLFDEYTTSYAQVLTAKRDAPGGPGRILGIPRFTFAVFPPGMLEPGNYRIGIACTLLNETVRYWDCELAVSRDARDEPSQLHWSVVGFNAEGPTAPTSPTVLFASLAGTLVALGLGITALGIRRQRASRAAGKSGERP